jgi:tyrosyl-tRNA synthetase
VETGLAESRSEANRLIAAGSTAIAGETVTSHIAEVQSGSIIKVGKRRFAKVIDTDKVT